MVFDGITGELDETCKGGPDQVEALTLPPYECAHIYVYV